MTPFAEALEAILAPLNYLARGEYAQLHRMRQLDLTLRQGLRRLSLLTDEPGQQQLLAQLTRRVPLANQSVETCVYSLRCIRAELLTLRGAKAQSMPPLFASAASASQAVLDKKAASPALCATAAGTATPRAAPPAAAEPVAPLEASLQSIRGIGPRVAAALASRGLHTVGDLLCFLPRRYQGCSGYQAIGSLKADEIASVEGKIATINKKLVRGRETLEVVLADETGSVHLMWFRLPYRGFAEQLVRGARVRVSGAVKKFRTNLQISHPEISRVADSGMLEAVEKNAVVPLYLEVDGVHPRLLRRIIAQALPSSQHLSETLPQALVQTHRLCARCEAITSLHVPPVDTAIEALQNMQTPWHWRLIYEELFFLQLGLLARKQQQTKDLGYTLGFAQHPAERMSALAAQLLPFALTKAQKKVLSDIATDFMAQRPMQRLLQGDVGSGKTAVALLAAAAIAEAGLQAAMMAPTELLAEQHARTAQTLLGSAGIRVGLLTGQTSPKQRRAILAALAAGELQVLIGTHALIQDKVVFAALGLAIVDEQHRFGVLQRARLAELGRASGFQRTPHMLVMTATPIPRTLALTCYGDLDLSIIDELPPGRTPIVTQLYQSGQRDFVYQQICAAVARGEQAYVVFPLVEESDKEGMGDIRAATQSAEQLAQGPLKALRLGLLHGRLGAEEKDSIMQAFLRRDLDVLIATTVIEVGIDVPNATVMVIEHAERFGLSQLHQLRGRVGRGGGQSFCYLLPSSRRSQDALRRLSVLTDSQDGFRIAEEDLAIRGPGDFIGTRQSGLPVLFLANLARDGKILECARRDAAALLRTDPHLDAPEHQKLQQTLAQVWSPQHKLVQIG